MLRLSAGSGSSGVKIVFYGLTITSSWGNGHATTYRSLCGALARRGHQIHFVEKDVEWYRSHRDLPDPGFCKLQLYESWSKSASDLSKDADVVVVGSYFPDAIATTHALLEAGYGPVLFYDIDTPVTESAEQRGNVFSSSTRRIIARKSLNRSLPQPWPQPFLERCCQLFEGTETPLRLLQGKPLEGIDTGGDRDYVQAIGMRGLHIGRRVSHYADRGPGPGEGSRLTEGRTKNIAPRSQQTEAVSVALHARSPGW